MNENKYRSINPSDYDLLLQLDKKVYPTNSPVTGEVLDRWYQYNPEFGIVFKNNTGMCIVIPLNKTGWMQFVNGYLSENEISEEHIFNNMKHSEIFLHIYHVEKLETDTSGFYKSSLIALNALVEKQRETNKTLKVSGFSGLCVTNSGISLFKNKLECSELYYKSKEYILLKDDQLYVFDSGGESAIESKALEGFEVVNRCQLLASTPDRNDVVWSFF